MPVFRGSRYRFGDFLQVEDYAGEVNGVHVLRETTTTDVSGFRRHTVQAGETFETLAFKQYGDARKWYVLADANPQVFWPLDLEAGQLILIPPPSYAAVV